MPFNEIEPVSAETRSGWIRTQSLAAFALGVVATFLPLSSGSAQPREIAARVVWGQAGRAYVVASDSGAVEPGLLLTLLDRRRVVATGEVIHVVDGTLASVRLTTGTLDRVKKLERLRVMAEPAPLQPLPLLRVGVPSGARANLAVECAATSIEFPFAPGTYRIEPLGRDADRGVRLSAEGQAAHWPDTLIVRRFGDAADQEIALARGELDVAVFWPGERSAHLRGDTRGAATLLGLRTRGAIAAVDAAAVSGSDPDAARRDAALASINAELFGGDLLPWGELEAAGGVTGGSTNGASAPAPGLAPSGSAAAPSARHYSVDLTLPGHTPIEHFLNGGASLFVRGKTAPMRVAYLDVPIAERDSLAAGWRGQGITPLFALRCPVVAAPAVQAYLRILGADPFANLFPCASEARRP
jgi:hypothetical protein